MNMNIHKLLVDLAPMGRETKPVLKEAQVGALNMERVVDEIRAHVESLKKHQAA
jgi:hypothetical protein